MDDNAVMRIVFLSTQTADAKFMSDPAERLRDVGVIPEVFALNTEDADDDVLVYQELLRHVRQADFVFMRCMSDTHRFKRFDKFETVLKEIRGRVLIFSGNPEITILNRPLFSGTDEEYAQVTRYAASRGPDNDYGMLHCVAYQMGFTQVPPPEPRIF